jgi:hypothetical protein
MTPTPTPTEPDTALARPDSSGTNGQGMALALLLIALLSAAVLITGPVGRTRRQRRLLRTRLAGVAYVSGFDSRSAVQLSRAWNTRRQRPWGD